MKTAESFTLGVTGQSSVMRFLQGRPSAVTFEVFRDYNDDDGVPEFTGTATVDAVNTTIAAPAGSSTADARSITVVSATGIVEGRKYRLGGREWIEPVRITASIAGAEIVTRQPITGVYDTGATLESTYASASLNDAWLVDDDNLSDLGNPWPDFRIKWTATIGATTAVDYSFLDLVRVNVQYGIDIEDVNLRVPGLRDSMPTAYRDDNGVTLLRSAWFSLQASLNAIGLTTDAVRDAQFIDEAMVLKTMHVLAQGGWHPLTVDWQAFHDTTRDAFNTFLNQHLQSSQRHPLSTGSGSPSERKSGAPIWVK